MDINKFRERIEYAYKLHPTNCGDGFDEILCFELHSQPVNPRMSHLTYTETYDTGLTFRELAEKWGITCTQLGELISDHCKKLD